MGYPELVRMLEMTDLTRLFFSRVQFFSARDGTSRLVPDKQVFYHRAMAELVSATFCRAFERLFSCLRISVSLSSQFEVIKWSTSWPCSQFCQPSIIIFECLFFA